MSGPDRYELANAMLSSAKERLAEAGHLLREASIEEDLAGPARTLILCAELEVSQLMEAMGGQAA